MRTYFAMTQVRTVNFLNFLNFIKQFAGYLKKIPWHKLCRKDTMLQKYYNYQVALKLLKNSFYLALLIMNPSQPSVTVVLKIK